MTKTSVKRRITKAIIEQIPECRLEVDSGMKTFWLDIRNEGGLRLSDAGRKAFELAEIENFEFPFRLKTIIDKEPVYSYQNLMLELSTKINCPYYIGRHKPTEPYIRIFDSKVAMMISLYGNIYEYLKNTNCKRNK